MVPGDASVEGPSATRLSRIPAIIVFSGPICAGKSSLAKVAAPALGARIVSARQVLLARGGETRTRRALQDFGAQVESDTSGMWLADSITRMSCHDDVILIVDAARTWHQLTGLRSIFNDVFHCHITASPLVREERFAEREDDGFENVSFTEASRDAIEHRIDDLRAGCDLSLDSTVSNVEALMLHLIASWRTRGGAARGS